MIMNVKLLKAPQPSTVCKVDLIDIISKCQNFGLKVQHVQTLRLLQVDTFMSTRSTCIRSIPKSGRGNLDLLPEERGPCVAMLQSFKDFQYVFMFSTNFQLSAPCLNMPPRWMTGTGTREACRSFSLGQALYSPLCLRPCDHLLCHLDLGCGGFWTYSFVASKSWLGRLFGNKRVFSFDQRITYRSWPSLISWFSLMTRQGQVRRWFVHVCSSVQDVFNFQSVSCKYI